MEELTPTELRSNLASVLRRVLAGFPVQIRVRGGKVMITRVDDTLRYAEGGDVGQGNQLLPKIPGEIIGSLDSADEALRAYVRFPDKEQ